VVQVLPSLWTPSHALPCVFACHVVLVVCRVHGRTLDDYIPAEGNLRDPSAVFRLPSLDILKAIITADVRAPSLRVDARALCTLDGACVHVSEGWGT
jgi:hypothetical protein